MKNLIKAVVFTLIFLGMLTRVSYILRPYSGSASRKNLCGFYAEENNTIDMVWVGSSAVFAFWEPIEFWKSSGITSYNFATGTMPPQAVKYCVKEVLKTQSPELFVIDLRLFANGEYKDKSDELPIMDQEVPIRNVTDNFKYSLNRLQMIHGCVPTSLYDALPFYLDIIKYHTEWQCFIDPQSLAFMNNSSHDSTKGFKLVDAVKPQKLTDWSYVTERKPVSKRTEEILRSLLEYCRSEELQVLFVVNPYVQDREYKEYHNYLADIIAEYNYDVINTNDYYEEIGVNPLTDYYDTSHMNILGADKYTKFMGNYILEHHYLEASEKNEELKERWDADYESWSVEVKKLKASIQAKIDGMD